MAKAITAKRKTTKPAHISEKRAEKIFDTLLKSPAPLRKRDLDELERHAQEDSHGVNRRLAFSILTLSGKKLVAAIRKDRDAAVAFAEGAECLHGTIGHLEGLLGFMRCAETRTRIALVIREDMQEIIAEARGELRQKRAGRRLSPASAGFFFGLTA